MSHILTRCDFTTIGRVKVLAWFLQKGVGSYLWPASFVFLLLAISFAVDGSWLTWHSLLCCSAQLKACSSFGSWHTVVFGRLMKLWVVLMVTILSHRSRMQRCDSAQWPMHWWTIFSSDEQQVSFMYLFVCRKPFCPLLNLRQVLQIP